MSQTLPSTNEKREFVQTMFGRIANHYDLLNKIISLGCDTLWRQRVVNILQPEPGKIYLDAGCGTGDLAKEIIHNQSNATVFAVDLTFQMIRAGKTKNNNSNIHWIVADAEAFPFMRDTFDGIVSGYLIRNVPDPHKALVEQIRVMLPGARVIALDTTPPERNWSYPLIMIYLRLIIPLIGYIVSRDQSAYSYLPHSTIEHLSAENLRTIFIDTGFKSVEYIKLMFGTMAIHSGKKSCGKNDF